MSNIIEIATQSGWLSAEPTALERITTTAIISAIGIIVYLFCTKIIGRILEKFANSTSAKWDDHLVKPNMIKALSTLAVAIICFSLAPLIAIGSPGSINLINKAGEIIILFAGIRVVNTFITSFYAISNETNVKRIKTLRGVFQVLKFVVIVIGIIISIGILINEDVGTILAAMGAYAAVVVLLFQDTILGFVAGVIMNAYDTLQPGDWVVMDTMNINGEVLETNLNIVKILNWDNSIATVPTRMFLEKSFQNYRQMRMEKSRRVCEKIFIDINSVATAKGAALESYKQLVAEWNQNAVCGEGRLTNLHFYRYYLEQMFAPLRSTEPKQPVTHRHIMVKTLQATPTGLPIEIYFFTSATEWVDFEHFKAEVVETAIASLSLFDLRPFQSPTGTDFAGFKSNSVTGS